MPSSESKGCKLRCPAEALPDGDEANETSGGEGASLVEAVEVVNFLNKMKIQQTGRQVVIREDIKLASRLR